MSRAEHRPDLVLIMTDQQRHDQVGYASGGHFETPNVDGLARDGVRFEHAYSASTTCVPARVALLTGLQPHRVPTQVNRFALREGFWTVARALRDAGYETALIGKMHFAPVHADHGFDTMRLCEHLLGQGLTGLEDARHEDLFDEYHDWLLARGLDDWRFAAPSRRFPYGVGEHPTGWVESEACAFLDGRDRSRPLFLIVSFPHPHAPYNPPEPYASMYRPADSQLPAGGFEVNDGLPEVFRSAMTRFGRRVIPHVDPENVRPLQRFLATVRGLVRHVDDAIGRVLERIDPDASVVFFTSDHGDWSGHRGLMRKQPWLPFDDLARVPFVVRGADAVAGLRVHGLVQSSDLVLTCLDYAGVSPPAIDFDTRSLRPQLTGAREPDADDRAVYCATTMGWPMVRRGRFKYVEHRGSRTGVLFDLDDDPAERVDLAPDPAFAAVVAELQAALERELGRARVPVARPV